MLALLTAKDTYLSVNHNNVVCPLHFTSIYTLCKCKRVSNSNTLTQKSIIQKICRWRLPS